MTEDKALMRLRQGDQEALGWLIGRYSAYVGAIAGNILLGSMSQADVEEVTADVFFALWQNAEKVLPLRLKGYLGRIARNAALKKLRDAKQELPLEEEILVLDGDSLFEHLEQQDQDALVRHAVLTMDEPDREIFLRFYYYCQPIPQIAENLGQKPSTVKSRLKRGRDKLRRSLAGIDDRKGGG